MKLINDYSCIIIFSIFNQINDSIMKTILLSSLISICLFSINQFFGQTQKSERQESVLNALNSSQGEYMLMVRIKTSLSHEELMSIAQERAHEFRKVSGLIQKYYIQLPGEGAYGGVYIFDSKDSFMNYKESDLAKSIAEAYQLIEAPNIELMNILFPLRD